MSNLKQVTESEFDSFIENYPKKFTRSTFYSTPPITHYYSSDKIIARMKWALDDYGVKQDPEYFIS